MHVECVCVLFCSTVRNLAYIYCNIAHKIATIYQNATNKEDILYQLAINTLSSSVDGCLSSTAWASVSHLRFEFVSLLLSQHCFILMNIHKRMSYINVQVIYYKHCPLNFYHTNAKERQKKKKLNDKAISYRKYFDKSICVHNKRILKFNVLSFYLNLGKVRVNSIKCALKWWDQISET